MKKSILSTLSLEEKKQLMQEVVNEVNQAEKQKAEERKAYKDLVNETIPVLFDNLKKVSQSLTDVKAATILGLQTLIEMKEKVFERDQDQYTHSFTTETGITLIVGHRTADNWDDSVTAGLKKVDDYISSLAKDDNSAMLVSFIRDLLNRDKKGNLNSKNVLKLRKKAQEIGNEDFTDGVNIIMDAYNPIKGASFVTVKYRNTAGESVEMPLDITKA